MAPASAKVRSGREHHDAPERLAEELSKMLHVASNQVRRAACYGSGEDGLVLLGKVSLEARRVRLQDL